MLEKGDRVLVYKFNSYEMVETEVVRNDKKSSFYTLKGGASRSKDNFNGNYEISPLIMPSQAEFYRNWSSPD